MKYVPENELFSAYLDGELTADEQAHVERLISEDPDARQLMDELRSLSSQLQTLPSHSLDEDFSQRVLRKAERQMLDQPAPIEPDPIEPAPSIKPEQIDSSSPWKSIAGRVFRPRNLVWSGIAVGIALMLMLVEKGQYFNGPNKVAMSPQTATDDCAEMASSEEREKTGKTAGKSGPGGVGTFDSVPTSEMPTEMPIATPTAMPTEEEGSAKSDMSDMSKADMSKPGMSKPGMVKSGEVKSGEGLEEYRRKLPGEASESLAKSARKSSGTPLDSPRATPLHDSMREEDQSDSNLLNRASRHGTAQNGPLIVICEVGGTAQETFDQILVEKQIPIASPKDYYQYEKNEKKREGGRAKYRQVGPRSVAVDLNPTQPQLQSMLTELRSRSEEFQKVADPVPFDLASDLRRRGGHEGLSKPPTPSTPNISTEPTRPTEPTEPTVEPLSSAPLHRSTAPESSDSSEQKDASLQKGSEVPPEKEAFGDEPSDNKPSDKEPFKEASDKEPSGKEDFGDEPFDKEASDDEPTLLVRFVLRMIGDPPFASRRSPREQTLNSVDASAAEVSEAIMAPSVEAGADPPAESIPSAH